jgi:hypothetical protein
LHTLGVAGDVRVVKLFLGVAAFLVAGLLSLKPVLPCRRPPFMAPLSGLSALRALFGERCDPPDRQEES